MNDGLPPQEMLDLRDYVAVLKRRKLTVILTLVVVVMAALTVTMLQTPRYESSAKIAVSPAGAASEESVLRELVLGQRELQTQRELAVSVPVAQRVIQRLELDTTPRLLLDRVTVIAIRDTNILEIRVTALEPSEAAEVTQAFAESYLQYRRDQARDRATAAVADLQDTSASIRERLEQIEREKARASSDGLRALEQEEQALLGQLGSIASQLAVLQSGQSFARGAGDIIAPAEVPSGQSSPRPLRNLALAIVLGGMLGVGFAFLRDTLDDAVRTDDEVSSLTGRPVLGHVPATPEVDHQGRTVSLLAPTSPAAEAYRTMRTNLRFLAAARSINSVLVTSAQSAEGKTTTAANLAVAAARAGSRVLLVGADLRRPMIHELFGVVGVRGLSDVLADEMSLADAVTDVGVKNLRVIAAGDVPPNPTELLASVRMDAFLKQASRLADLVIYDGPPILGVADGLEIAPRVDAVLLVVDTKRSGRSMIKSAVQKLDAVGADLAGAVMNRVDSSEGYYGYYGYGSYTATDKPSENKPNGKPSSEDAKGTQEEPVRADTGEL